ncbi:hypothetical protein F5884DRAFT_868396 [Xylogone sp. PMI_703]|nr:hypothetical protein F5884DRAFT_868396 [Xylogone sp. PMI_703]
MNTKGPSVNLELEGRSLQSGGASSTSSYIAETSANIAVNDISVSSLDIQGCQRTIVGIITGYTSPANIPLNENSTLYLQLLDYRVRRFSNSNLVKTVIPQVSSRNIPISDALPETPILISLFRALVIITRALETGRATIDSIARQLLEFVECGSVTHELYQFVFRGIALVSLLYDAEETISPSPSAFRMVLSSQNRHQSTLRRQQSSIWRRLACPITDDSGGNVHIDMDQLLSHFGQFVPPICIPVSGPRKDLYEDALIASNLNYHTISKIGHLKVEWVESLSLHLDLYERGSVLRLFAYPSFLNTNSCRIISVREVKESQSIDDDAEQHAYSFDFLVEVLSSYRLIFGQHASSYAKFSSPSLQVVDPLLKKLCGTSCKKHNFYSAYEIEKYKTMYSAAADFPLLGQRLLNLQRYMNEQNPSDLRTLWGAGSFSQYDISGSRKRTSAARDVQQQL